MRLLLTLALLVFLPAVAQTESVDLVRVNKAERKMTLLYKDKRIREYKIALGGNPTGHKQQEGDSRTPEGRYVLDYKKADSAFYKSIHISYPNKQDVESARKRRVKPGGFIMIHGQPNGYEWAEDVTQKRDWTDGCIALKNADMDEVWKLVRVGTTIEILP